MRLTYLLIVLVSAALVACGGGDSRPASTPTAAASATAAAAAIATATPTPPAATAEPPTATAEPPTATPAPQPTLPPPPPPTSTSAAPPPPSPPSAVRRDVRAFGLAYNVSAIEVPSGATVTLTLDNADVSVPHDLGVNIGGVGHTETCVGPCTRSIVFTAPAPGSYQFFCSVHPDMVGAFIVR